MIKFSGNFYFVKNKIVQLAASTGAGSELDKELDTQEEFIIKVMTKIILKDKKIKIDKKSVLFMVFEDFKWLEATKKFKSELKFDVIKMNLSPAEFWKADKKQKNNDIKALKRPDKEESYS